MKAKITNTKRLNILGNDDSSNREILTAFIKQFQQKLSYYSIFAAFPAILTAFGQEAQADESKKTEVSVAGQTTTLLEKLNKSCSKPEWQRNQSNYLLPHQKGKYTNIVSQLAGGDNCPGTPIPPGTYTVAAPFTDSGNTTGANNTVNRVGYVDYCYYNYGAEGPDQIYSFTLTGLGSNPQIQVSATSANYSPMIYILESRGNAGCPASTGNFVCNERILSYAQGGIATLNRLQMNSLPLNVPLYLFVDSTATNNSGPYTLRIQDVGISPATQPPPRTKFDFDGDGKADISVFRPSDGVWYLNHSQAGSSAAQFGSSTDKIVPADYDGDGKTDIAVFRNGVWYLQRSTAGFIGITFGAPDDIPQPADFNNDGKAEIVLFRPSNGSWYVYDFINNQVNVVAFGQNGDKPVVGDYDGDSKADIAVFRPSDGFWYIMKSQDGFTAARFGTSEDKTVPADYDGDGKTDIAVFRPSNGTWYLLRSQAGFTGFQFGSAADIPIPADYDGDGLSDAAFYRDGIWYLARTLSGFSAQQFGAATDKPIPAAFLP